MIDENKIESAKEEIYEDKFLGCGEMVEAFKDEDEMEMFDKEDIKEAIGLGAEWAINEFLKDLWHDGEEVPKEKNKSVLMWFESYSVGERELDNDEYYDLCNTGKDGYDEDTWKMICDEGGWCSKWLYLDDLQKGGKQ